MGQIRDTILGSAGRLIGVAVALVVLALVGAMSILGANNSANLASATSQISQFLPIVGVAVAVGLTVAALSFSERL